MRVVLQFIITGCHENELLLDALVGRVECVSDVSNSWTGTMIHLYIYGFLHLLQLCPVSLELLYLLVDLNCEDVMLELILKLVFT